MFNSITLYNFRKKYLQFSHFPGKFEFLVKSKKVAILDDVTDPQQRYNPKYLPYFVEYITGNPLKVKSFQNIEMQQKPKGGGGVPSTPLVPRWGHELACTSEG